MIEQPLMLLSSFHSHVSDRAFSGRIRVCKQAGSADRSRKVKDRRIVPDVGDMSHTVLFWTSCFRLQHIPSEGSKQAVRHGKF